MLQMPKKAEAVHSAKSLTFRENWESPRVRNRAFNFVSDLLLNFSESRSLPLSFLVWPLCIATSPPLKVTRACQFSYTGRKSWLLCGNWVPTWGSCGNCYKYHQHWSCINSAIILSLYFIALLYLIDCNITPAKFVLDPCVGSRRYCWSCHPASVKMKLSQSLFLISIASSVFAA